MKRSDRVFFNMARQVSFLSDYHGPHMGCVCVDGHRVVTSGHNAMKTNPMQHRYNRFRDFDPKYPARVHAEVTLYVYREHKDGSPAMARPCKSCMALIKNLGIKKVFYTTDDGFAEEKIEY